MIRFLSPGFAWAFAAPAAVLVLYLLRRRFQPRRVPSVFLWRRSIRDYSANRPFQRLMKNLLLPLQILALLALALAMMRPAIPGGEAGRTVLIFDVSGSMNARTEGKTRLDLAKERAFRLMDTLPAEEKITVLTAGEETKRLALNADREQAGKAVSSVACERGGADLNNALTLAAAVAGEDGAKEGSAVIVFSDTFRPEDVHLRNNGYSLTILNSGRGTENRAVYSLTAEPGKAFARAANYGEDCSVTLVCEADGVLCGAKEAQIPAGETAGVSFDLPENAETVRVSLREKDSLAEDNAAETAVKRPAARKAAVTGDSVFLESALRVRPDLTVIRTETDALEGTGADLYVLGTDPLIITRKLPEGGYDPDASAFGPFSWGEKTENRGEPSVAVGQNPLTSGLTMRDVFFRSWRPVTGGRAAVSLDGEPAVAWTEDTVVIGFDLHDTNLPLKYDFPVLIQNILELLLPGEKAATEEGPAPMPREESDTRITAPDYAGEETAARNEQGRELTWILLAVFLALAVAEMGVSRYVG